MRSITTCCLIILLLPFLMEVRTGTELQQNLSKQANGGKIPFSLQVAGTDMFVLPGQDGTNGSRDNLERYKNQLCYWKIIKPLVSEAPAFHQSGNSVYRDSFLSETFTLFIAHHNLRI
ncbi:MAG TPA: hypothetical protein PLJ84_00530 [Bacteroidales bacterium]|nr:hypothetical protein [Bacteroidales bacterium]HPT01055.1 hypothetical protein [Bacteroidales bacterium]